VKHQVDIDNVSGLPAPNNEMFAAWVDAALSDLAACSVSIRVVDPAESQSLNAQWRGKTKPTNVLSFPGEQMPGAGEFVLGDIVVCAAVVEQEALEQGKPASSHWAHMVIHGLLHLRGYDHIDDQEADEMEQVERELLAQLSISDPYALVV
jgi:probable rRNA maturation factor